jgi:protein TonB
MQALIAHEGGGLDDAGPKTVIDFVRLKRDSRLDTKKRAKPDKPPPQQQPVSPSMSLPDYDGAPVSVAVQVDRPAIGKTFELTGGPSLGAPSDTDTIPLVRINPIYPRRAAERRIEGWVVVKFSINEQGMVENPEVVDADPRGIFESAAIRAIRKWKYRPKIEGGKPVKRRGISVKLTFDLEDE